MKKISASHPGALDYPRVLAAKQLHWGFLNCQIWQPLQHLRSATTIFALSIPILYVCDRRQTHTTQNTGCADIRLSNAFFSAQLSAATTLKLGLSKYATHAVHIWTQSEKSRNRTHRADSDWQFGIKKSQFFIQTQFHTIPQQRWFFVSSSCSSFVPFNNATRLEFSVWAFAMLERERVSI